MDTLKNATILAIDDDAQTLFLLNKIFINKCKEILLQNNAQLGLSLIQEKQPDLILLDVFIDQANGVEVCKQLKMEANTQHIPVIFLSSSISSKDKVQAFLAGGVDYISKPFDIKEAIARVESCLATHKKIQSNSFFLLDKKPEIFQQYQLNKRELEIIRLYISGHKRCDIATKIIASENTVKWYLKQIFQKLEVNNRADLIEKLRKIQF